MKLFKIFSTVLFFCFLGSFQNQLFAQNPTKKIGYWTRTLNTGEYLENGEYRARLEGNSIIIYRNDNGAVIRTVKLYHSNNGLIGENIESIRAEKSLAQTRFFAKTQNSEIELLYSYQYVHATNSFKPLQDLEKDVYVQDNGYYQLEDDGRFVIYNGSAIFQKSNYILGEFINWR